MKKRMKRAGIIVTSLLCLAVTNSATAEWEWSFAGTNSNCIENCAPLNTTNNYSVYGENNSQTGAPNVTATAWTEFPSDLYGSATSNLTSLGHYSGGLGVVNWSYYPDSHTIDSLGFVDSILLTFQGAAVALTEVVLGWIESSPAEFQISYYAGNDGVNNQSYLGSTEITNYSDLTNHGWESVGSYSTEIVGERVTINGNNYTSSYWLITALNSTSTINCGCTCGCSSDNWSGFKLYSVAANQPPPDNGGEVPEPTTLLLMGLMLPMLMRKKQLIKTNHTLKA